MTIPGEGVAQVKFGDRVRCVIASGLIPSDAGKEVTGRVQRVSGDYAIVRDDVTGIDLSARLDSVEVISLGR